MLHRGRIAKPVLITEIRSLSPEETAILREPRATPNRTAKFRDSHHRVALLFALGYKIGEVATITGYSHQRLYTLKASPGFDNLIAEKRTMSDRATIEANIDDIGELTQLHRVAVRHQRDYFADLDEAGEIAPPRVSLAIAADTADRIGYAKFSVQANVSSKEFASTLERAIKRSGVVIEAAPASVSGGAKSLSHSIRHPLISSPIRRLA